MASVATNINLSNMNDKQLRKVAKDVGVNPVTINSVLGNHSQNKSILITAIKAK